MEMIDLAGKADDNARFDKFLEKICQDLEFDVANFGVLNLKTGQIQGFSTYREDWKRHYTEESFHLKDPTLHAAFRSVAPVDWSRMVGSTGYDEVFNRAADFNLPRNGVSIPVRGPFGEIGLLCAARDCPDREWDLLRKQTIVTLQQSAVFLHDGLSQKDSAAFRLKRTSLSRPEKDVLRWAAGGLSQGDIADRLMISERTVDVYLRSARTKLRALTTPQAIGRAVMFQLIDP